MVVAIPLGWICLQWRHKHREGGGGRRARMMRMQARGLLLSVGRAAGLPPPPRPSSGRGCCAGAATQTSLIRQVRERSGAPMKDVKAALVQCGWDPESAFTELRRRGLAAATKKPSRVARDGLLGLAQANGAAAIVEINSETDFVARNDIFQHLVSCVAKSALCIETYSSDPHQAAVIDTKALEEKKIVLQHPKLNGEASVCDAMKEAAALMGENIKLRRGFRLSTSSGVVSSYLHMSQQAGLARVAGLLTLEAEIADDNLALEPLSDVGASLAMHIVAARPLFLSKDHATSEVLERERDVYRSQVAEFDDDGHIIQDEDDMDEPHILDDLMIRSFVALSNKPEAVIQKVVEGKLAKYMEEFALLEQKFVINDKINIRMVLDNLSKEIGKPVNIGCFLRLEVGEGVECDTPAATTIAE